MSFEIQKASMTKRIGAFILDLILLAVIATGVMLVVSAITGYDNYSEELTGYYDAYAKEYNLETFDLTQEEIDALSKDEKDRYDAAFEAMQGDSEVMRIYSILSSLMLLIPSLGIFFAYALLEFAMPLVLHNGQTIGKKVFNLGVIRCDGVKMTTLMLFVRTLLGKFTIETMIPLMFLVLNGVFGIAGLISVGLLAILEIVLLIVTKNRSAIHDTFAQTAVVDLPSQMIFDTPEELLEYKKRVSAELAAIHDEQLA